MRYNALAVLTALCLFLVALTASAQERRLASMQHGSQDKAAPSGVATRVFVTAGEQVTGQVNGPAVHLTSSENLSVVWMAPSLRCAGGRPENADSFSVPSGAELTCMTDNSGVTSGITAVTARLAAPVSSGNYRFGVNGCASCARNITVTTNSPFLTTDTGYTRDQVNEEVSKVSHRGDNCCDLAGGYLLMPDTADSTASEGHGFNLMFQTRPLEMLGVGLQYTYSVQNVWLNQYERDAWTDDDQPEHLHQLHGRVVFSAPVADWCRLEVGGLVGAGIWHYESFAYDQYQGSQPDGSYTWQTENVNNQTQTTFDVGGTGGVNFYPTDHFLIQLGIDAVTNVNGINRVRANTETPNRMLPDGEDGHDLRLALKLNLGVAF